MGKTPNGTDLFDVFVGDVGLKIVSVQKHVIHYPGHLNVPARADVTVYEMAEGKDVVLISQPRDDYTGLSVTNGIERIATEIYHSLKVPADAIFIEHYPTQSEFDRCALDKPSFDVVEFTWRLTRLIHYLPFRLSATRPDWRYLGQDGFSQLTGLDPESV